MFNRVVKQSPFWSALASLAGPSVLLSNYLGFTSAITMVRTVQGLTAITSAGAALYLMTGAGVYMPNRRVVQIATIADLAYIVGLFVVGMPTYACINIVLFVIALICEASKKEYELCQAAEAAAETYIKKKSNGTSM